MSTSTKKNRQREHARFGACFFIHSKSTLSLWMSLALAWLSLGTLNHKRIRRANFLSLIVEHSENVVWKVRCRLLLDTSVTRNGDLLPSWRFWHPLGDKKLAWRLAIFWKISKILVAILAILNFIGILCKNLLHKKYFDTSWTQFLFAFFPFLLSFHYLRFFPFLLPFHFFRQTRVKFEWGMRVLPFRKSLTFSLFLPFPTSPYVSPVSGRPKRPVPLYIAIRTL